MQSGTNCLKLHCKTGGEDGGEDCVGGGGGGAGTCICVEVRVHVRVRVYVRSWRGSSGEVGRTKIKYTADGLFSGRTGWHC